jgi:membrane-associated phospholipid phosphatase
MELKIVKFFNQLGNSYADALTKTVSHIFLLAALWASIALWALFFDKLNGRELFVAMGTASVLHFAVSEGIFKMLFPKFFRGRKRPYIAYPDEIRAIGREHRDSSFPSSHMSTTTAMLMVITYFYPFLWPASVFATFLMAYARLHNGMHYLSDIAAGTVLGALYGLAGIYSAETLLSFIF